MAEKRITDVDFVESLDSNESFLVNKNNSLKQINKGNIVFGIANGGTDATTADEARKNLGAITMNPTTVELKADGWVDNEQAVNASGVTANNPVFISPEPSEDNFAAYTECGVRCIDQAEGILIFSCKEVPSITIAVNVVALSL